MRQAINVAFPVLGKRNTLLEYEKATVNTTVHIGQQSKYCQKIHELLATQRK